MDNYPINTDWEYPVQRRESMGKDKRWIDELLESDKSVLVNEIYNNFVRSYSDKEDNKHGKRIPYLGWYWRDVDFVGKSISIGYSGKYIGVMENNKWGYPERYMTKEEVDKFIDFIEKARIESMRGGQLSETMNIVDKVFKECWDWFQTLKIERNPNYEI